MKYWVICLVDSYNHLNIFKGVKYPAILFKQNAYKFTIGYDAYALIANNGFDYSKEFKVVPRFKDTNIIGGV